MRFNEFLKECREKDVFKNLSIYLVSSWLVLQVFSVTWEPLGLPKVSLTYLLLFLLIGFPLYLYLLWRLRIRLLQITAGPDPRTRQKGKRASSKSAVEVSSDGVVDEDVNYRNAFRRMYFSFLLVTTALSLFTATFIIKANFFNGDSNAALATILDADHSSKIAVLTFENNSTDPNLDVVGKMAADWIMHGITQNKVGQVISSKIVDDYSSMLKSSILTSENNKVLKEYLKPSQVISGTYYLNDGNLLIQCSITDGNLDKTLISFEAVSCNPAAPLDCIEALKQKILGFLVTQENSLASFEETPPNFEAYQFLIEAHTKYNNTEPEYLALLNDAIAADTNFFTPKIDRLEYYYNMDEFAKVDSLYRLLSKEVSNNKRQTNLLNLYESLLKGDNRNAYKYFLNEYTIEPLDLENNSTAMVLALQFVNRPQDLEAIYNELSMQDMDLDKCLFCEFRSYTMALALIDLDRSQEAIDLLAPYKNLPGHKFTNEALLRAYVKLDDPISAARLMDNLKLTNDFNQWNKLTLFGGIEFLREGNLEIAGLYFDAVIEALKNQTASLSVDQTVILGKAYYYKQDFLKAAPLLESAFNKTNSLEVLPLVAVAYQKNNNGTKAGALLKKLEGMRAPYQYGQIDYGIAQFYAANSHKKKALEHLLKAVAAGYRYSPIAYQYDIHFKDLVSSEDFDKIMNFWK